MRKSRAKKREVSPDPRFNDQLVSKFINNMMLQGKKETARKIFYEAIDLVDAKIEEEAGIETWKKALNNVMPSVMVKSRRVGGATYQIPMEIKPDLKVSLGIKWMINFARKRNEKSMANKLAGEIIAASKGEGASVKRKEDTHKMADANKAFSHFRV
ncbi:MAG TPA: 30S ribosomal protein S7 [Bacteroidetes bacterium]|jgi:small subunit ribosomal protein S7|nr:30S ribosomal protein S7 [Bacteroidota bacterium]HCD67197.1 30S ribosomal protein S7 [Bacteroidota bacterium]|tara:strand:+ start:863 stop:1333 length:471 start_codon:yes stop_codon:yes gene_type:complete